MPERMQLIQAPTPLHRLNRLSEELGLDLWIKRDDLTGFALGGNKGRKLEFLLPDMLAAKATVAVTCGSLQSNFIRQLGGACSMHGLKCAAAVMDLPYEVPPGKPDGPGLSTSGGNVLLDQLLGVDLRVHPDATWDELYEEAEDLATEYEARGEVVYRIPIGGSSPVGACGFVAAAAEIIEQGPAFDAIVVASGSGSTQTGLTYALHGSPTRVIGVSADPEPQLVDEFVKISEGLDQIFETSKGLGVEDFDFRTDWVGPGYGIQSEAGNAAIVEFARKEGIFLDPVYSGKAAAGLLDMAKSGELKGRVLLWHTGGTPTLFAM